MYLYNKFVIHLTAIEQVIMDVSATEYPVILDASNGQTVAIM